MSGDFSSTFLSFLVLVAVVLFFTVFNKPKKQIEPPLKKKPPATRSPMTKSPMTKSPVTKKVVHSSRIDHIAPSYQVEKKSSNPFLKKGWKSKSSLKQSIIISEVLRRWDEGERKF